MEFFKIVFYKQQYFQSSIIFKILEKYLARELMLIKFLGWGLTHQNLVKVNCFNDIVKDFGSNLKVLKSWQLLFKQHLAVATFELIWISENSGCFTAQKMKFCIKAFFSKCDQIRRFLKKSLKENFIFCAVFLFWLPSFISNYIQRWCYYWKNSLRLPFYLTMMPKTMWYRKEYENRCP